MIRIEDKYFLNQKQYFGMRSFLEFVFETDPNAKGPYWVHSQYFDTRENDFYLQKVNGEFDHIKIRRRWYDSSDSFYELKYKKGIHQIKKKLDQQAISQVSYQWGGKTIYPKVQVSYQREAFEFCSDKGERIRVTFDQNLRVGTSLIQQYPLSFVDKILMEVKYSKKLESFLDNQFKKMGLKKVPFSKYELAISFLEGLSS